MGPGFCAWALRLAAGLGTLWCLSFVPTRVAAQLPVEASGLRGGRHVGMAAPVAPALRLALGLKYAYTEGVLGDGDRHHRAGGELAVAYTPLSLLQVALELQARYDGHQGDDGNDRGGAFASGLLLRHALALTDQLGIGLQTRLRFPAAESLVRGLRALTPELALLATGQWSHGVSTSLLAGYRFERSIHSVADPTRLSDADRLAAELSRFDAALLGLLIAAPLGPLTASLEGSWDIAAGRDAPQATASPIRVRAAAQLPFGGRYVAGAELGVSPSARPDLARGARIEPRLWAALSLSVSFATVRSKPPPADPAPLPTPSLPEQRELAVRVIDATGAPITGAQVVLAQAGEPIAHATNAEGIARFATAGKEHVQLTVTHPGYHPHEAELADVRAQDLLAITLQRDLPEGEIKGKVRSLRRGRPVAARISVSPLGKVLTTDDRGDFSIAVPPGQYTLKIEAEGYEPQERPARVEHLGVTILVIDLRKVGP